MKKALTLKQPWADAVCHLGKGIENRTRPPPRTLPASEMIAIHAGMARGADVDGAAIQLCIQSARWGLDMKQPTTFGAVVAVCRVAGWMEANGITWKWQRAKVVEKGPAVTAVRTHLPEQAEALAEQRARWYQGPYGWLLADVQVLAEPVPVRGALGLWRLPDGVERAVMAQVQL